MQVYKWLRMKTNLLMILEQIHHSSFKDIILIVNIGENNCLVFLQTLDGWVYIDLYMGLLMGHYTWAQYTPTISLSSQSLNLCKAPTTSTTQNKIGQGGFGPVYCVKLRGRNVAVKMFNARGRQGHFEF